MSDNYQPHAVPASALQSNQPKSTILKKPHTRAKKGLGAKKTGGLGAQKVKKIDFEELEKNAEEADKTRTRLSVSSSGSEVKAEEKLSESSRRLVYQEIENRELQNDKKLSTMDDKKKQQAVRLGMGMGKVEGVSHSLKIMTIDQQTPQDDRSRRGRFDDDDIFYDAKSSHKDRWYDDDADDDTDNWGRRDFSYKETFSSKDSKTKPNRSEPPTYTITPIEDTHKNVSSVIISNTSSKSDDRPSSRQRKSQPSSRDSLDQYRDAKAISSSMLFGDDDQSQYEHEQRMRNLDGKTSISSSDYFGTDRGRSSSGVSSQLPDLGNLKEGVRNVAGKMSSMVSGIASTIQDRYGT